MSPSVCATAAFLGSLWSGECLRSDRRHSVGHHPGELGASHEACNASRGTRALLHQYSRFCLFRRHGRKLLTSKACGYASCVVTAGTGFSCPTFVSLDSSLDVYVSNTCDYGTAVYKMAPGCTSISCASTVPGDYLNRFNTVSDKHGNLYYVPDYSHGYLKEVPAGCQSSSCVVRLGDGFSRRSGRDHPWDYGPTDIALDKHGNVYAASYYYISEMPPNCHSGCHA